MHKSELRKNVIFLTTILSGLIGCTPAPERVSIDLTTLARQEFVAVASATPGGTIGGIRANDSLAAAPKRNLLVGSGQSEANVALAAARDSQERAYKEALADLTKSFKAAAAAKGREESALLRERYRAKFGDLYDGLRAEFEKHADQVGPLWVRLSTLAGFPDKAPASKRLPPPVDFIARKEALEAIEIRKQIALLDAAYRKRAAEQIEDLRQEFRLERSDLEAKKILGVEAAVLEAEQEAKRIAADVLKGLEKSMINEIEKLEAVAGSSVTITSSTTIDALPGGDQGPEWTSAQRLVARANLFARTRGYRLEPPGPGVRDATKEFSIWESQWDGR